jgi:hypothetical protein
MMGVDTAPDQVVHCSLPTHIPASGHVHVRHVAEQALPALSASAAWHKHKMGPDATLQNTVQ